MADLSPPSMARHRLVGRFLPWLALAAGFVGFFALGLHRYISFDTLRQHRPVTFVYASVGAGLDSLFAAGGEFGAQNILAPHILMALIGLAGLASCRCSIRSLTDVLADGPEQLQHTMRGQSIRRGIDACQHSFHYGDLHDGYGPQDEHNARLRANTHPLDWHNLTPRNPYNLVVIGAGTVGLVTAAGAAAIGARVALIEKHLMGRDCLNYGCVPSKGLIRCATARADVWDAGLYGVEITGKVCVDFGAVMERMRRLRVDLSDHDSVGRFTAMGVDVFLGLGRFAGPRTIAVGGSSLIFAKAVIATGSRPAVPSVPGLEETGYLTNETVFNMTERSARLGVIGGGPIGCELAQTFQRLGSQVILVHRGAHVLNKEEADAAEIVQQALRRDGVQLILAATLLAVEPRGGEKLLRYRNSAGQTSEVAVDAILVAAGRKTADFYNRTRLSTRVKQLMAAWLWWQRRWSGELPRWRV